MFHDLIFFLIVFQGYEGSLLKVTSKNGKTASVSENIIFFRSLMHFLCTYANTINLELSNNHSEQYEYRK